MFVYVPMNSKRAGNRRGEARRGNDMSVDELMIAIQFGQDNLN